MIALKKDQRVVCIQRRPFWITFIKKEPHGLLICKINPGN